MFAGQKGETVAHKEIRKVLRVAQRNGARIENGMKHYKVYSGDRLVMVVAHGTQRDKVPGGLARQLKKKLAAEGLYP